ncbi:hypothetical protein [Kineosporia sp. NBRC 101731]|uniref:hypothetical protein n=1 Tax=Kineosporia sp. NBRC 101731 TaxID=3032199 RepID=UPI0024A24D35|nr:hypothetical protein [Kineosporia sp. NBRC 101731]GLY33643.1 hypothetical protein Kisp02_70080 [Kineosporia sp. NBRC 101731]
MGGGGWPLLRRAPGRMLRSGSLAVMITVSVALLAGLVAAGPLFGRATAAGSLERKLATVPSNTQLTRQAALGVTVLGPFASAAEPRVTNMVDEVPWLGEPITSTWASAWQLDDAQPTPFLAVGQRRREAVLWYRTGAVEALDVVQGKRGAQGIWLPDNVATSLRLEPGDTFRAGKTIQGGDILGCAGNGTVAQVPGIPANTSAPVKLAGTYRTGADGALPTGSYFSSIASLLPGDPLGCPTPATLMIGDRESVETALAAAQETPTWTYSASLVPAGRTPQHLEQAAAAAQLLKVAGADPSSELTGLLTGEGAIGRVETALPELQTQAEADARTAAEQGRGIAYAGGALGLAAVVVALQALAQRRRRETELLLGLGTPVPVVIGAGALELLLPAVLGAAVGGAGAWLAFWQFGPQSELGPGAVRATVLAAGFVAVLTLVAHALVTLLQTRTIARNLAGLKVSRGGGPWLPLLTGATVLAVGATLSRDGNSSYTDPLAAVLPILVLACGCALVVRLAVTVAGLFGRWRAGSPARASRGRAPTSPDRLVLRGLRNTGVAVADLVVVLAIGIGVLAYGLVSANAVHASALDKASVMAGANSAARIPHSYDLGGGEGPTPDLPAGRSVVWRATGQLRPDYVTVDVLVVDPAGLRRAASWGEGPELAEARTALGLLESEGTGGSGGEASGRTVSGSAVSESGSTSADARNATVPAVLVGVDANSAGATGSGGTVLMGADEIKIGVRGSVKTFPGTGRPTILFDATSLFASFDARNPNLDPARKGISERQGTFATWVWSQESPTSLDRYLADRNITVTSSRSLEESLATPVLTSSGWAASYQVVLGAAAAALAGLSVVVAVDRRVARAAPVDLVLRRFGLRRSRLIRLRATELALTCLGALAALAPPFALMLVLLPRLVEPGPDLAPAMGIRVPLGPLALSALAAAVVTVVAVMVAARRSATLKPAEVLRDDQ